MKAKMSIPVRLKLSDMLAAFEGDCARLLMYRKIREDLSLSEEEQKLVGYISQPQENGMIANIVRFPDKDPQKEIEVGEIITEEVCKKLKHLSDTKVLKPDQLDLYLWFQPAIDKMFKVE